MTTGAVMLRTSLRAACIATAVAAAAPALAAKMTVSNYAHTAETLPWAVAIERGMFREAGLDVDGITAGAGGGTSVRNMLASELAVAELSATAVLAAARAGLPVKIVAAASNHPGELAWVATKASGITTIKDLVGKKAGYSNPKSVTEMVLRSALKHEGLTGKVELISTGGLGPGLTALTQNAIAAAPFNDPQLTLQPDRYRVIFQALDYLPQFTWSVIATTPAFAQANPKAVRAVLEVHRKAVAFIYDHPAEAARIYAKVWEVDVAEAEAVLPKYYPWRHWAPGDFSKDSLDALQSGLILVGDIDRPMDLAPLIDQSFLPEDLQRPLLWKP
jgi:NitT/TauT family transport system substrate-binding protein